MTMTTQQCNEMIHEYKGRFFIASYDESRGQYQGSLRPEIQNLSGCSGFFCSRLSELPGSGGYSYSTRAGARRAVRRLNDW